MRNAFVSSLVDIAAQDERIWLLTGDLGFGALEPFAERYPDRYLNAGVAEQNMVGMATGLALSGKVVFVYSIANFSTMRCLEQIRNDAAYHGANVKVVSIGSGFSYGAQGYTHYGIEDIAVMRAFAKISTVAPGDPEEVRALLPTIAATDGTFYLRLGRAGEPVVHSPVTASTIRYGAACKLRDGTDVTIISTGNMLDASVREADRLREDDGLSVRMLSMHTLAPLDRDAIADAARETRAIVTVEEHMTQGGIGSAVADTLVDLDIACPMARVGVTPEMLDHVGAQPYMRSLMKDIPGSVKAVLAKKHAARPTAG